jgi:predicted amidohydrolase YtcJ
LPHSTSPLRYSYTIDGAIANFLEDAAGSIELAKSADLVVLNEGRRHHQGADDHIPRKAGLNSERDVLEIGDME